jgi:hypothetical protein
MLEPTMLGWGHGCGELKNLRSYKLVCFAVRNAQSTLQRTYRTAVNWRVQHIDRGWVKTVGP